MQQWQINLKMQYNKVTKKLANKNKDNIKHLKKNITLIK